MVVGRMNAPNFNCRFPENPVISDTSLQTEPSSYRPSTSKNRHDMAFSILTIGLECVSRQHVSKVIPFQIGMLA
jgi:hypothetical protein